MTKHPEEFKPADVDVAFDMALDAHQNHPKRPENRFRKDGKTPYITHPVKVQLASRVHLPLLTNHFTDCVLLLHDVLEDTTYPGEYIQNFFGDILFEGVLALTSWCDQTKMDSREVSRKHRWEYDTAYLERQQPIYRALKLCDMYVNIGDMEGCDAAFTERYAREIKARAQRLVKGWEGNFSVTLLHHNVTNAAECFIRAAELRKVPS